MFRLNESPLSWEAVAACQVLQASSTPVSYDGEFDALYDACDLMVHPSCAPSSAPKDFNFASATRLMNTRVEPYWQLLAESNGVIVSDTPLTINTPVTDANKILICPYGPDQSLHLGANAWKYMTKSLRSYQLPVLFIGDKGQRMDSCAFLEDETLSSHSLADKIQQIASSTLVVGVPNAWLWLAVAMHKKVIAFYPDNQPQHRWLWQFSPNLLRLVFAHDKIEIPTLLTGIRQAIAAL